MNRGKTRIHAPSGESDSPPPGYDSASAQIGDLLLGRYEVFQVRAGGFALVLCVTDQRTGRDFAIKIPKEDPVPSVGVFEDEVSFWLRLDPHPNIVKALFVELVNDQPALFMEYVGGSPFATLREWLDSGALPETTVLAFAYQIASAMEFANRRGEVVHSDLKPQNILITPDKHVKVTDFGLAHTLKMVSGAYPVIKAATWEYAAPEVIDCRVSDSRSDIYSFALVMYEMLTGHLPFDFELSDDPATAYSQMVMFHRSGGIKAIAEDLYYKGVRGCTGRHNQELGIFLSACLQHFQSERPRNFADVLEKITFILKPGRSHLPVESLSRDEDLQRAIALRTLGRVEEALGRFNILLVKYPKDSGVWHEAALTLEAAGESERAREFEEKALHLSGSSWYTRLRKWKSIF